MSDKVLSQFKQEEIAEEINPARKVKVGVIGTGGISYAHFNNYKKIIPKPICLDNVEFKIRYCDDHKIRKKGMLHSVRFHTLEMDEESAYLIGSYDYMVWK